MTTGNKVQGIDGDKLTIVVYGPQGAGKTRMRQLLLWLLLHTFAGLTVRTTNEPVPNHAWGEEPVPAAAE